MKHISTKLLTLLLIFGLSVTAYAQKLPFQGRLYENGTAVNQPRNFVFSIAGTTWTETLNNVQISDGLYSVVLGAVTPLPGDLFQGADTRTLNIAVNGQSLTPVQIYAAMVSPNLTVTVDNASVNREASITTLTGVGAANRLYRSIVGISSVGTGVQSGVTGEGISSASSTNNTTGVFGKASGQSTTGEHRGVYGEAQSPTGSTAGTIGIFGRSTGTGTGTHYGSYATAEGTHTNFGGFFSANGQGFFNNGVRGLATGAGDGSTGYEVGSYNIGASGYARDNQWGNIGVHGWAYNNPQTGIGVGVDNIGVLGRSEVDNNTTTIINQGMYADARGPGINYGIKATASGGEENWAGFFEGDVKVTGNLILDNQLEATLPDTIRKSINTPMTEGVLTLIAEGEGGGASAGLITSSSALVGSNSGVRSSVTSVSTNTANHYGYLANVTHEGTGQAGGVWANMFGNGTGIKIGVRTAVSGNNSSLNYGVRALNSAVTTDGGSNWGGLFTVTGTGVANSTNVGVEGSVTKDNGRNIGIKGVASGGTENWAGWFEGDVKVTGNLILDNPLEATLPDTIRNINNGGDRTSGFNVVSEGTGSADGILVQVRANSGSNTGIFSNVKSGNGASNGVYALVDVTGNENSNFSVGSYGVATGSALSGTFAAGSYGQATIQDGGDAWGVGAFASSVGGVGRAVRARTQTSVGNNLEQFGVWGQANGDGTGTHYGVWGNAEGQGTNIGVYGRAVGPETNWAGFFQGDVKVTGNLSVDGQGGSIVASRINQDYGNFGEKNWEDGLQGYLDLRGDAPEGTDNIRVALGVETVDGETKGQLDLFGPVYNNPDCTTCPKSLVSQNINKGNGDGKYYGQMDIWGENSPNIQLRSMEWEDSDRGWFGLFGNEVQPDGWFYRHVEMQVEQDVNGKQSGSLSLFGSQNKSNIRMGGKSWEDNNGVNRAYINLFGNGENVLSNWEILRDQEGQEFGQSKYFSTNGNEAFINHRGLFGAEEIELDRASLRSNWGNNGQGALLLRDVNNNDRVTLSVNDYFDDNLSRQVYVGNLNVNNSENSANINVDGNGYLTLYDGDGTESIKADAHSSRFEAGYGKVLLFKDGDGDGEINLRSNTDGIGIRMYGKADFGDFTSHIAVDQDANNYVHLYGTGDLHATGSVNTTTVNATTVNQSSDARLKTNILPLNNTLSNVMKMRGVSYNWIDTKKSDKLQIGVIAQEVEEIYPEFVHTNDEGMKSVNYSQMVAVLIEAIKELNTKVETLEAANSALTSKVADVSTENEALKASLADVNDLKGQMKNLQTLVSKLVQNNGVATSTTTSEQQ
uniref:tail fiber domain-containing protein n=1 Tax=Fulvivirga sp. TaxID=1931237 RepID=UPI00404A2BAF